MEASKGIFYCASYTKTGSKMRREDQSVRERQEYFAKKYWKEQGMDEKDAELTMLIKKMPVEIVKFKYPH